MSTRKVLCEIYLLLILACHGCSYSSSFDSWAKPMGECFTDDDSPPSSYILSCNQQSNVSLMVWSNNDCSGIGTQYNEPLEFGTINCDEGSCNIARWNIYKTLNDTNCNDRSKYKFTNAWVMNKCIPTDGGYGSKKAGFGSCDSVTNTLTIKWYYDINCQNQSEQRSYSNECVQDYDDYYKYTEIECYITSDSSCLELCHWIIYCLSAIFVIYTSCN